MTVMGDDVMAAAAAMEAFVPAPGGTESDRFLGLAAVALIAAECTHGADPVTRNERMQAAVGIGVMLGTAALLAGMSFGFGWFLARAVG